jgi:aspartyl-tRNA(Asn)/glutamyl-tRNA(Gln) amidotransferase subunit B
VQETRLYDPDRDETRSMRSKEDAMDYRYFPDPDLLPLDVAQEWIDDVKSVLPELPQAKRERLITEYGLNPSDAAILTQSREFAEFYEKLVAALDGFHKLAASWMAGEFSAALNRSGIDIGQSPIASERFAGLLKRIADNTISGRSAKEVFDAMWNGTMEADAVIEEKGLKQISDSGEIGKIVDAVLASNAQQVADYRAGREKAFNSLVGQVMKASKGKANPAQVNALLKQKLAGG